jgi:hypothetical protein
MTHLLPHGKFIVYVPINTTLYGAAPLTYPVARFLVGVSVQNDMLNRATKQVAVLHTNRDVVPMYYQYNMLCEDIPKFIEEYELVLYVED